MNNAQCDLNNGGKILVVDDDPFIVKLIIRALRNAGFSEVESENSSEACLKHFENERLADSQVSIVICDVLMPGIDGFELCGKIKKNSPQTHVILMSGYEIHDISSRLIDSGASDFMIKPFNTDELAVRTRLLLARSKTQKIPAPSPIQLGSSGFIKVRNSFSLPYIGDKIADYVVIDFLGWGQSTVIYKVVSPDSKKVYALKMLTKKAHENQEILKRFDNEISILSKISHENVISYVLDARETGTHFLVMEFVEGMDLEELLVTKGRMGEEELAVILLGVARGLAAIHEKNIIHRDVKLKNILCDLKNKTVKISDFGIALESESLHLTMDGFVVGTPLYMAPELLAGVQPSVSSDIFSFGATAYHLIGGTPPFTAKNRSELLEKMRSSLPPPISFYRSDLKNDWDSLIRCQCLARSPVCRPVSMADVVKQIESFRENL